MLEIPAIAAALAGIKNATDIARIIKESGATLEQAEFKLKLADLISALADTKGEVAAIRDLLAERDAEIRSLKENLKVVGTAFYEQPYYFLQTEKGKDGPYCQRCYDGDRKLIRLQSPGGKGFWECMDCKSTYKDKDYKTTPYVGVSKSRGGW